MISAAMPAPISEPDRRCLPEAATDSSIRVNMGGIARGRCRDRIKMAFTDATHRALRPKEARSSGDDTALPVDFLPHRPHTGDRATAAHLGDRICKAVRPASSEMLALDPAAPRWNGDELVARGCPAEEVAAYWPAPTGSSAPGCPRG
jgi:hypothetical protein